MNQKLVTALIAALVAAIVAFASEFLEDDSPPAAPEPEGQLDAGPGDR